tara:strand:- start:347 stop:577 length:231 start_codon:yes stop_codon:yes gene_type:complete
MNRNYKSSDYKRAYQKAYYQKNKDMIRLKMAEYNGTDERKKLNADNHKRYYNNNKPQVLDRMKKNYYKNKDIKFES